MTKKCPGYGDQVCEIVSDITERVRERDKKNCPPRKEREDREENSVSVYPGKNRMDPLAEGENTRWR